MRMYVYIKMNKRNIESKTPNIFNEIPFYLDVAA